MSGPWRQRLARRRARPDLSNPDTRVHGASPRAYYCPTIAVVYHGLLVNTTPLLRAVLQGIINTI
jgi:hypothetical protein